MYVLLYMSVLFHSTPRLGIIYQAEYFHLSSAKIVIELNSFLESEFQFEPS